MELRDKDGLTEKEYFETFKASNYPKPSLTADNAVFAKKGDELFLLLIKRGGHPFLGHWALPGGFADPGESSEITAARELEEETSLSGLPLFPVGFYSDPGRDPRGWTVSMAYASVIDLDKYEPKASDDAAEAVWFNVKCDDTGFSLEHDGTLIKYEVSGTPSATIPGVYDWPSRSKEFRPLTEEKLAFDHYKIVYDSVCSVMKALRHADSE